MKAQESSLEATQQSLERSPSYRTYFETVLVDVCQPEKVRVIGEEEILMRKCLQDIVL